MRELLASSQLSQVWIRQCSSGLPVRHRFSEVAKVPTSLRGGTPVVNPNLSDRVVYDAARRIHERVEARRRPAGKLICPLADCASWPVSFAPRPKTSA